MFKATTLHFITDASPEQLRALLYLYVEHHPECLEDFVVEVAGDRDLKKSFTAGGQTYALTHDQYQAIRQHCLNGNKLAGIKEHRMITNPGLKDWCTNAGLKESKDWIEDEFYVRDGNGNWILNPKK